MSEATNTKMMDTEPGGEQTQYVLLSTNETLRLHS